MRESLLMIYSTERTKADTAILSFGAVRYRNSDVQRAEGQ